MPTTGTNFVNYAALSISERNAVLQRELHQAQFLIADLRQYHDKHQQLVHTLTSSKAEVEALKDELASLKLTKLGQEQSYHYQALCDQDEIKQYKQEIQALKDELAVEQEKQKSKDNNSELVNYELAALEQEKQKLKDNNSDLESCLKTTQAEVLVTTEELSSVKKLLKDSNAKVYAISEELSELKARQKSNETLAGAGSFNIDSARSAKRGEMVYVDLNEWD